MTICWYMLDEDTQKRLRRYQRRHYRSDLNQPEADPRLIHTPLEGTEEIGKIMAMAPGDHRLREDK